MVHNHTLLKYCPATGIPRPYPSHAGQWRQYKAKVAWLFNPFTGEPRTALEVGMDPYGIELVSHDVLLDYLDVENNTIQA